MRYRYLFLVLALPLLVVACQDQLRSNLVKTCNALNDVYAHYDAVAESGAISVSAMRRVAIVRVQTDDICTSPETATTVTLTAAAGRAYVALNAAFNEANSKTGSAKLETLRSYVEEARRNH